MRNLSITTETIVLWKLPYSIDYLLNDIVVLNRNEFCFCDNLHMVLFFSRQTNHEFTAVLLFWEWTEKFVSTPFIIYIHKLNKIYISSICWVIFDYDLLIATKKKEVKMFVWSLESSVNFLLLILLPITRLTGSTHKKKYSITLFLIKLYCAWEPNHINSYALISL